MAADKIPNQDYDSVDQVDGSMPVTAHRPENSTGLVFLKSSGGQYDSEILVTGDESLPWRQNRIKPWTEETVQLKKTPRQVKQIEKEKVEAVELKPAKIQKTPIERAEIEKIELRPQLRAIEDVTLEVPQHIEEVVQESKAERRKRIYKEKYQTDEDSNILDVSRTEEVDETKKAKQTFQSLEDATILKSDKEEMVMEGAQKYVPWRKPKEQLVDDAKSTISDFAVEEALKGEIVAVPWRRGKNQEDTSIVQMPQQVIDLGELPVEDKFLQVEDAEKIKQLRETKEEIRDNQPHQKPEQKPWTEQVGQLKKTQRQVKPIEKEHFGSVELKPTKVQKIEVQSLELEEKDIKQHEAKILKENIMTEDDSNLLKVTTSEEVEIKNDELKAAPWKKSKKLHAEDGVHEKPQEETHEKKTWPTGKRHPQEPEEIEGVQLKPIPRKTPQEKIKPEEVSLKPVIKAPTKDKPDEVEELAVESEPIAHIEKQPDEAQKAPWRRGKKEKTQEEIPEEKTWPTGKRHPQEPEQVEGIQLKPIPRKTPQEKTKPEEVSLKPVTKALTKDKPDEIEELAVESEPIADIEKQPDEAQKAPWRRGKKEKTQEETTEEKTWPTGKRHPQEPEQVEDVQLKPIPRKTPQEKTKPEEVSLKPVTKAPTKDKPDEIEELAVESEPIADIEKQPDEAQKAPWRRGKKEKTQEETTEEKTWPTGKRHPQEPEQVEGVQLKPIPTKTLQEKTKPEEVSLKPVTKAPTKDKPDEAKEIAVESEPIADIEKQPDEAQKAPWRRGKKEKSQEEIPEEKTWPTGKRHPQEPEQVEDVQLKPIPRKTPQEKTKPEEVSLKPVTKAPTKDKPDEAEEIAVESEPFADIEKQPDEAQKAPWRRGKKEKTQEETTEEKTWPTGKRHPQEPEQVEGVQETNP